MEIKLYPEEIEAIYLVLRDAAHYGTILEVIGGKGNLANDVRSVVDKLHRVRMRLQIKGKKDG